MMSYRTGWWNVVLLKEFGGASLTEADKNTAQHIYSKKWPHTKQFEGESYTNAMIWNVLLQTMDRWCMTLKLYELKLFVLLTSLNTLSIFSTLCIDMHILWHAC